jgi:RNA polymerase sigma-70 factor (ECF subfamily)
VLVHLYGLDRDVAASGPAVALRHARARRISTSGRAADVIDESSSGGGAADAVAGTEFAPMTHSPRMRTLGGMSIHDTGPSARERRFTDLFAETYAAVLRFVERRIGPSGAEDVAAEVFLVLWRRFDDVPADGEDARAWLFGVARRTMMARMRGERRRQALAVRIAVDRHAHAHDGLDADLVARRLDLAQAWARLSSVQQEVLALTVWDGLDAPRAARVLGISPVAFRLRLSRARKALRAHAKALPQTSTDAAATIAAERRTA